MGKKRKTARRQDYTAAGITAAVVLTVITVFLGFQAVKLVNAPNRGEDTARAYAPEGWYLVYRSYEVADRGDADGDDAADHEPDHTLRPVVQGSALIPGRHADLVRTGQLGLVDDPHEQARGGVLVDLHDSRWAFTNTQFSQSAGCLYAQCVDLLDERLAEGHDIPEEERALMDRALAENAVIVAQMTPFFDE